MTNAVAAAVNVVYMIVASETQPTEALPITAIVFAAVCIPIQAFLVYWALEVCGIPYALSTKKRCGRLRGRFNIHRYIKKKILVEDQLFDGTFKGLRVLKAFFLLFSPTSGYGLTWRVTWYI